MFGINWRQKVGKTILISLIAVVLTMGIAACGDRLPELPKLGNEQKTVTTQVPQISEVSPPTAIQKLGRVLDQYQPQITILSPKPQEVLQDNTINVQLQVQDLPIFKSDLGLGPHLEVILDNQPYKKIYDLDQPLAISDLEPGTHTLRVFANRPWDESFKNEGAYATTTFHIFTKTPDNNPESNKPLLTYNSPTGILGAEPILLDFYLTNAPLHFVAQENPEDEIVDWRVKVTVNGTSFTSDRWQPMYLKGFKPGKNWLQLEFLDELGNPINNVYNNTARLIIYEPNGKDTLSKLIQGELPLTELLSIVDPTYKPEPVEPEPLLTTPPPVQTEETAPVSAEEIEEEEKISTTKQEKTGLVAPTSGSTEVREPGPTIEAEDARLPEEPSVEEKPAEIAAPSEEGQLPAAGPTIEEKAGGELSVEEKPADEIATPSDEEEVPAAGPTIEEEASQSVAVEEKPADEIATPSEEGQLPAAGPTIEEEASQSVAVEEKPADEITAPSDEGQVPAAGPTIGEKKEEDTPTTEPTTTPTETEPLNSEITPLKPASEVEPLDSQEQITQEPNDDETLLNRLLRQVKGFSISSFTQKPAEGQTETPTEESENQTENKFDFRPLLKSWRKIFSGSSENVSPTVESTLPEIVEEAPSPKPLEKLAPEESPNLIPIPEKETITEDKELEKAEK